MHRLFARSSSPLVSNVWRAAAVAQWRSTATTTTGPTAVDAAAPTNDLLLSLPFRLEDVAKGQRRALAKAITMVESDNPQHAHTIAQLLRGVKAYRDDFADKNIAHAPSGPVTTTQLMRRYTPRIAVSGSPGAGKSCFIEAFGLYLIETFGFKVGVIAVDPSSSVSHGAILGDKTRMERLSMHPNAYVRPSPSRGHLGGLAARTWEAMSLLECAQFDIILVETVGVGQSEIAAKYMTDVMLLLVPPASGDELQGIKKGIVEVADIVVVTKNDGERTQLAQATKAAYTRAVQFGSDCGASKSVVAVSAETNVGIDKVWDAFLTVWKRNAASGALLALRRTQEKKHFKSYFEHELILRGRALLERRDKLLSQLEDDVMEGRRSPREAGEIALDAIFSPTDEEAAPTAATGGA